MVVKKTKTTRAKNIMLAVSRFGHDPLAVQVPTGSTVDDVLEKAEIDLEENQQVFNAGEPVSGDDEVESGDVLSIVSPKAAGL